MARQADENGVAQERHRMEQEFTRQRIQLAAGAESFAAWQSAWETRHRAIDAALNQLSRTLGLPKSTVLKVIDSQHSAG